jgi:hypothetical protein
MYIYIYIYIMSLYSASGYYTKSAMTEHFNNNIDFISVTEKRTVTIKNTAPLVNNTDMRKKSVILYTNKDIKCVLDTLSLVSWSITTRDQGSGGIENSAVQLKLQINDKIYNITELLFCTPIKESSKPRSEWGTTHLGDIKLRHILLSNSIKESELPKNSTFSIILDLYNLDKKHIAKVNDITVTLTKV